MGAHSPGLPRPLTLDQMRAYLARVTPTGAVDRAALELVVGAQSGPAGATVMPGALDQLTRALWEAYSGWG